jgi:hypothetical protein
LRASRSGHAPQPWTVVDGAYCNREFLKPVDGPNLSGLPEVEIGGAMAKPPKPKVMKVELWLRIEGNNKDVRGRKKAHEEIEQFVLSRFQIEERSPFPMTASSTRKSAAGLPVPQRRRRRSMPTIPRGTASFSPPAAGRA